MMSVIVADDVSKRFLLRHRAGSLKVELIDAVLGRRSARVEEFWALRDVSLRIAAGESLGLIGRNGSGKSTLLKLVAGIHRPTQGHLLVPRDARIGTMIELGLGFHPELSGAENVYLNAAIHGLSREQIDALYAGVVEYSGLARFMDVPLKSYSSGMHLRLAFSVASQIEPSILLIDEIFAVGDDEFQRKCVRTLRSFREGGCTIVFVSHSAGAIRSMCQRVCALDRGRVIFDGETERGLGRYARLLAERDAEARVAAGELAVVSGQLVGASADADWHRRAAGPRWAERGAWALEFLRRQGLTPSHFLLDIGCGDFSAALHLLQFMEPSHYWGYERQRDLFDAAAIELTRSGVDPARGHILCNPTFDFSIVPYRFDVVFAGSLFVRLPLNQIAHSIAAGLKMLKPGGTLYATWYDADPPSQFDSAPRCEGFVTYGDREPYHYTLPMLARVCDALGGRAELLPARTPVGESVLAITPVAG